ncbi:hypothetical protein CYMTET_27682, partial [Cymbomonas tetramitiformis]
MDFSSNAVWEERLASSKPFMRTGVPEVVQHTVDSGGVVQLTGTGGSDRSSAAKEMVQQRIHHWCSQLGARDPTFAKLAVDEIARVAKDPFTQTEIMTQLKNTPLFLFYLESLMGDFENMEMRCSVNTALYNLTDDVCVHFLVLDQLLPDEKALALDVMLTMIQGLQQMMFTYKEKKYSVQAAQVLCRFLLLDIGSWEQVSDEVMAALFSAFSVMLKSEDLNHYLMVSQQVVGSMIAMSPNPIDR